jgi:hypothetical protein
MDDRRGRRWIALFLSWSNRKRYSQQPVQLSRSARELSALRRSPKEIQFGPKRIRNSRVALPDNYPG